MAESNLYSNTAGIIPILHLRKQVKFHAKDYTAAKWQILGTKIYLATVVSAFNH